MNGQEFGELEKIRKALESLVELVGDLYETIYDATVDGIHVKVHTLHECDCECEDEK